MSSYNRYVAGYLVNDRRNPEGIRTYACSSEKGLHDLIVHLTGKKPSTFPLYNGLPKIEGINIVSGLHIYS